MKTHANLYSEIEPPARESMKRISPQLWTLGSSLMCTKVSAHDVQPLNTILSWHDGNSTFHLLPRDEPLLTTLNEGDSVIDRIQDYGTGGAVWGIGNEVILVGLVLIVTFFTFLPLLNTKSTSSDELFSTFERELQNSFTTENITNWIQQIQDQRIIREKHENEDLNCNICTSRLENAVEVIPCGHVYCGDCILKFWTLSSINKPIICPKDNIVVHMIIPSFALRAITSKPGDSASNVDLKIKEYNRRFSTIFPRDRIHEGLQMGRRLISDISFLNVFVKLRVFLVFATWFLYLLLPFDIIPEAAFGVIGWIDDLLFLFTMIYLLGMFYRSHLS